MSETITMQSMLRTSTSITSLAKALAVAVNEFDHVAKDREVSVKSEKGSYKFSYATLAEIVEATRPALSKNGLVVVQMPTADGARTILITRLIHESGEWLEGVMPVPTGGANIQQLGSALTYLRRYAYSAILGVVASDEDDDGNSAANQPYEMRDRQRDDRVQRPAARTAPQQNRAQQQAGPDDPIQPGSYVGADGKVYPSGSADAWLDAWIKRTNTLMKNGDMAGLQSAFDRNREAIEATARDAPEHAHKVRKTVAEALAAKDGANDNQGGAAAPANDAAKLWVIYHTEASKAPDPFDGPQTWTGAWTLRASSVERSRNPVTAKRQKVAAMVAANEANFAALEQAGHTRPINEARAIMKRLDDKLAAQEADEMTGSGGTD